MENNYTVYMHIFPNGKRYIGITCQTTKERFKNGCGYSAQPYVYNAIKKYGWDNIEHKILATNLTEEKAIDMEISLIAEYDLTNRKKGYNRSEGGKGVKGVKVSQKAINKRRKKMIGRTISEETKKKISEGNKIALKKYYEEHPEAREKMSQICRGRPSWNKGKKLSPEHLEHLSKVRKGRKYSVEIRQKFSQVRKGHSTSEETKRKISASLLGKPFSEERYKHLIQSKLKTGRIKPLLDIDNNIIYITKKDIAKKYNVSRTVIDNLLKGKKAKKLKLKLRYLTEMEKTELIG